MTKENRDLAEVEEFASAPVPHVGPFSFGERVRVTDGKHRGKEGHVVIEARGDDPILKVLFDGSTRPLLVEVDQISAVS